jgi:hypothetical protein
MGDLGLSGRRPSMLFPPMYPFFADIRSARVDDLVRRIKARWLSEGIDSPEGVSEARLRAFEEEFGVTLPQDMRLFFSSVNGMGRSDIMDDNLFTISDIDSIFPCKLCLTKEELSQHPQLEDYYNFASQSFDLPAFCIKLRGNSNEIVTLYNSLESRHVCVSFSDFLSLYLADKLEMFF